MAYVAADGTVGGGKSLNRMVTDFFGGIWMLIMLFFRTITNPQALEGHSSSSTRTYAQRNQGRSYRTSGGGQTLGRGGSGGARPRGANIRGVNDLGDAQCAIGGG